MSARWILLAALVIVTGCDSPTRGPQASHFDASLDGAIVAEYQGTGTFSSGTRPTGQPTFHIFSEELAEPGARTFSVRQWDGGRPGVGTHTLESVVGPLDDPSARGLSATVTWVTDSGFRMFVSDSGTLVVTRSTSRAIEGTFEFVGSRFCAPYVPDCGQPDTEEATLRVEGSFSAVPVNTNATWNAP